MELKDIAVEVSAMQEIRGGANSITQSSVNGPVTGVVSVGGGAFNMSPVTVTSMVGQSNLTSQQALIEDRDIHTTTIDVVGSQISAGFPFARRGWSL
ncbi:MAG: hypothetical protein AB8B93_05875 [Pseudomonadales bacterium]